MAATLLASRNEPYLGEREVYMRKNHNPNPKLCTNPNPNSNSIHNNDDGSGEFSRPMESDDSSSPKYQIKPPSVAAGAGAMDSRGYVSFPVSTYSRKEIRELKRKLMSELDKVRALASRIESSTIRSDSIVKLQTGMMNKCGQILTRLMKQKKSQLWFNVPVDAVKMGLHDYHHVIKNPMDLGTINAKLTQGVYSSPLEFASDIRLTFENALLYNPKGHDVYKYAELQLRQFESSFAPAYGKFEKQISAIAREEEEDRQKHCSWAPVVPPRPPSSAMIADHPVHRKTPQQANKLDKPLMMNAKGPAKPKPSDPNKRAMSMDEKVNLGSALQSLPEDKMMEALQIIRKRNQTLQNGDEVEIDFELMDNETLWDLDRFTINWRRMTKGTTIKKEEPMATPAPEPLLSLHLLPDNGYKSPPANADGETPEARPLKKSKKGEPVDEDIDIGDDIPATHYPSVEIEKKESSSSSSGSDSSSSSDSDSGSSSGSDSDDNKNAAQSPAVVSRPRS